MNTPSRGRSRRSFFFSTRWSVHTPRGHDHQQRPRRQVKSWIDPGSDNSRCDDFQVCTSDRLQVEPVLSKLPVLSPCSATSDRSSIARGMLARFGLQQSSRFFWLVKSVCITYPISHLQTVPQTAIYEEYGFTVPSSLTCWQSALVNPVGLFHLHWGDRLQSGKYMRPLCDYDLCIYHTKSYNVFDLYFGSVLLTVA
ncbi:hypothetical protein OG21DRAFT_1102392 [Imleria badia]|nr:hypothetical protein OG21DRAFT_1102392 [Imleria badia]